MKIYRKTLGKTMRMAGLRRVTPEMAEQFSTVEKVSAGMGAFFSLRGAFFTILSFFGFYPIGKNAVNAIFPPEPVTELEEVAKIDRDSPVNVAIHVDFEQAAKIWTVKKRYFVTPVKDHEGRIYFFRRSSYVEDEGVNEPIQVRGWATVKNGIWGWNVPGMDSQGEERLSSAGMNLPGDAVIVYESSQTENRVWTATLYSIVSVAMAIVVWVVINRIFRTIRMMRNSRYLAEALNERLGFNS